MIDKLKLLPEGFPKLTKFIGKVSGKTIHVVEYGELNWPRHGKASFHLTRGDAEKELKEYQKERLGNGK